MAEEVRARHRGDIEEVIASVPLKEAAAACGTGGCGSCSLH
jgi:hypothetical protein